MRENNFGNIPRLYQIFHGEVASLQSYGAFIKIPGCRKQGLVHISQLSSARVEDPAEMLARGERVYCKVIAMEGDGQKISLSMKVVSQTTGQDLDPNNVQSSQDEKRRRQWNFRGSRRIELGAELNTTCRRCGGHGHLAMDCFAAKGRNQYGLIPELDELTADELKLDRKHRKKDKKKKKQKKRRSSSESDNSDLDDDRRRKCTAAFSKGHSGWSEKGRQRYSESGSGSDLEGVRHKEDHRQDHLGRSQDWRSHEKNDNRRRLNTSDSEGDSYSTSQGRRQLAGSSKDFLLSASRAWPRSGSRERVDGARESERSRNKSDEKYVSRRDYNFIGETEKRTEPHRVAAKRRNMSDSDSDEAQKRNRSDLYRNEAKKGNRSDSDSDEAKKRDMSDSYRNAAKKRDMSDSCRSEAKKRDVSDAYRNETRKRDTSDSYRNEAKKRDVSDSYRNEAKKRDVSDSYRNEAKKRDVSDSYRNEAKKRSGSNSDSDDERLRVKRNRLNRDKYDSGRHREDNERLHSSEISGRKSASTTKDGDRYGRNKY